MTFDMEKWCRLKVNPGIVSIYMGALEGNTSVLPNMLYKGRTFEQAILGMITEFIKVNEDYSNFLLATPNIKLDEAAYPICDNITINAQYGELLAFFSAGQCILVELNKQKNKTETVFMIIYERFVKEIRKALESKIPTKKPAGYSDLEMN